MLKNNNLFYKMNVKVKLNNLIKINIKIWKIKFKLKSIYNKIFKDNKKI